MEIRYALCNSSQKEDLYNEIKTYIFILFILM